MRNIPICTEEGFSLRTLGSLPASEPAQHWVIALADPAQMARERHATCWPTPQCNFTETDFRGMCKVGQWLNSQYAAHCCRWPPYLNAAVAIRMTEIGSKNENLGQPKL